MKKIGKIMISLLLALAMLVAATVPTFAVDDEEYLCELRLIYAEDYIEAEEILADSAFYDYEIYDENLNEGSGEIGVWLAYKTTTDIEDAITDITVMQMKGGYREGNYQEMIEQSRTEYRQMAKIYMEAIDYWRSAYVAGHFLAESAYRQLNFYNMVDEKSVYNGMRFGDIFYRGIDETTLATVFLEGNSHALGNIRALLAMGVSYNPDGKHYFDKVAEEAQKMQNSKGVYGDESYDAIARLITAVIRDLGGRFEELAVYEPEMNYYDDDVTELELKYLEDKSLADRMREVDYLDGKTLYDFCLEYAKTSAEVTNDQSEEDLSDFYPLVGALNKGQLAMTKVFHYYDVLRYSMTDYPEEEITAELDEMEETYSEFPFDIYTGVDRSIYEGTFALTTEAYRAETYTDKGLLEFLTQDSAALFFTGLVAAPLSALTLGWALCRTKAAYKAFLTTSQAKNVALEAALAAKNAVVGTTETMVGQTSATAILQSAKLSASYYGNTYMGVLDRLIDLHYTGTMDMLSQPMSSKLLCLQMYSNQLSAAELSVFKQIQTEYAVTMDAQQAQANLAVNRAESMAVATQSTGSMLATGALYVLGGALWIYFAVSMGLSIYNYYHPDYDDIPVAMVDLIDTVDGDRYIKYDVVREVEAQRGGEYAAADLNAFEGQRWNALYYTKSYEAGKPLMPYFDLRYDNNIPDDGYAPVRRFGEVVCYNLNKYHFDADADSIYLSVEQSENQKSAVADVPELVGSMLSGGWVLLAGGVGLVAGIGVTMGTQKFSRGRKNKETSRENV